MSTPETASTPPASTSPWTPYGTPVHVNRPYGPEGKITPGWEVSGQDVATGAIMHAFVPDGYPLAETADEDFRAQSAQLAAFAAS